jgi:hypothetical protein
MVLICTTIKTYEEWRYSSAIFNLDVRWRRMVSFTLWLLYSKGSSTQYPLHRRLDGPQSWSGPFGMEKNLLLLPEMELWPSRL